MLWLNTIYFGLIQQYLCPETWQERIFINHRMKCMMHAANSTGLKWGCLISGSLVYFKVWVWQSKQQSGEWKQMEIKLNCRQLLSYRRTFSLSSLEWFLSADFPPTINSRYFFCTLLKILTLSKVHSFSLISFMIKLMGMFFICTQKREITCDTNLH